MKFLLDKYIAGLCFYRTAFPVQKSGLKSSAFRSKSFPQISSESYRHNAVSNRFSSHLSTSPTNAATFVSRGCGGYTLGFAQRIAHNGTHGETGGVSDGGAITTLRAFLRGSETLRGRVSERRTLPLLGLGRVYSRRTQRACGAAMRLCASLLRGVAAPLGCVILLPLLVQPDLLGWKDLTRRSGRVTITRNNRTDNRLALVWEPFRAVK